MRILVVLAITISVLLAFGVACGGDGEEARVTAIPTTDSEDAGDEDAGDEDAGDEDAGGSSGFGTPEEALAAFLADYGSGYAGDCAGIDLETDVGYYCSNFREDRGDTQIYDAGQTFTGEGFWLLVERQDGDGWTLVDTAAFAFDGSLTPPW